MVELSINPELFAIIPEPTKEDFLALKESIESVTQHKPITVWKDLVSDKIFIIDGHSRYEACKQLRIEPIIEHKEFENWLDAMRYAIHVNSKRRHLTQIQKVNLALREIEIEKQLAKERQRSTVPNKGQKGFQKMPNGIHTGNTCDIVSKKTGISTRTVARLKQIIE
ncbi:MAG: ParB N-terminal domain-containing protein, partial [Thaumarchaeota archaeon]|nr:ParB N-terminal domain-containing protein [Nitrososphaerota archaeon]